jgi:ATP-binding cassette subfamily B protein
MNAPENTVLVDDIPVRKFPLEQLRRSVGFVQQETFLFSNTLENNILFGVQDKGSGVRSQKSKVGGKSEVLSLESQVEEKNSALSTQHPVPGTRTISVEKAAAIAGMTDDIRGFPNGYQQLVGERGITLSGGQKQRTAIARAVMRNPRILILDDSLSAVDTLTEEKILHGLREVRTNRTTLIVSHRISTIKDADLICVMQEGEIIESGTHEELLELNGEYADLYQRQLLEEEIEATD